MKTLSPRQRLAALLIASGSTHRKAAAELKVSPKTMCQWTARPDFRTYVDSLLAEAERETAQALKGLRLRAVEKLSEFLEHQSPGIALRVVESVLDRTDSAPPQPPAQPDPAAWTAIISRLANEAEKPAKPH